MKNSKSNSNIGTPEFRNINKLFFLQNSKKELEKILADNRFFRKRLLVSYYNICDNLAEEIIELHHSKRREICEKEGVNPYIVRTLFDYNSYTDCYCLFKTLGPIENITRLSVLDFGCMVSDYGFYFGSWGANITICDFQDHVDFAKYRLIQAGIKPHVFYAPSDYLKVTREQKLVIFSEVLEHLKDPFDLLTACIINKVKYVYTTCYPYGNKAYFKLNGHTREAEKQAPECHVLLKSNYREIKIFKNYRRLWILKK